MPSVETGTHCSINRQAHRAITQVIPKDSFPDWKQINTYEGLNGLDGLWLKDQHLPSRSSFDPVTGEGEGIEELWLQYNALVDAFSDGTGDDVARQCAYVSHIITDISTPSHQHGKVVPEESSWGYGIRTINNWREEAPPMRHLLFEFWLTYRLAFRRRRPTRLNNRLLTVYQRARQKKHAIVHHVTNEVKVFRKLNLYKEYIQQGWTRRIEQKMSRVVLPRVTSSVATHWYLAYQESKKLRTPRLTGTRH